MPKSDRFSRDRLTVERGFWPKFRRVARRIPFAEDLLAAYYAAIDPKTPFSVRATLFGALAYFVMPADLIPDFVAVLGFTDDAAVLAAALRTLAGHIRPEHKERARHALEDAIPGEVV
ncbi:MAG TPA: YkvA family protein [Pseudomonadales bacterium]